MTFKTQTKPVIKKKKKVITQVEKEVKPLVIVEEEELEGVTFSKVKTDIEYPHYASLKEHFDGEPILIAAGFYRGTVPNNYNYNHIIEGKSKKYGLSKAGHLDLILGKDDDPNIPLGTYIKVYYIGTELLEKGPYKGKESHQFDVEIADNVSDPKAAIYEAQEEVAEQNREASKSEIDHIDLDNLE